MTDKEGKDRNGERRQMDTRSVIPRVIAKPSLCSNILENESTFIYLHEKGSLLSKLKADR